MTATDASLSHQTVFGTWHIHERIGVGGVAEVYRTAHIESRAQAALKVMHPQVTDNKDLVKAFAAEYQMLEELSMGGVPKVRKYGEVKGRPAMLLEYIDGTNLFALQAQGRQFDVVGALMAMAGIAAYVHGCQIIHNDLKLENFLLTGKGRLVLVDFGNARRAAGGLLRRLFTRTTGGAVFGTASYLAPELITGGQPSFASDCYALGVCAHILFTGSAPFVATRRTRVLNRAVKEDAPSLADKVEVLPRPLVTVLDRCLAKDPTLRPQHADEIKRVFKRHFADIAQMRPAELSAQLQQEAAARVG